MALEDRVVLVQVQHDAGMGQRAEHALVALARAGLVVVVGVDRLHAELARQLRDLGAGRAVAHDQADALDAVGASEPAQLFVEVEQRLVDELDPAVGLQAALQQRLQDVGVEDEGAPDLFAVLQRMVERGLVARAQVAPEPNQSAVIFLGSQCHVAPLRIRSHEFGYRPY